jgi:dihydrofolate reductase
MSKVTCDITVSADGFAASRDQSLEKPFGEGVDEGLLHGWMFEEDEAEANAEVLEKITEAGAHIMGRNMFTPGRGEWDPDWKGYWGENPPYHAPVFVLTHHPREPVPRQGGTTFHFVTDGIEAALEQAREAAGDKNVAIAGGTRTVNQYLAAGLIDELRLHIAPVVLNVAGERLFDGVGNIELEQVAVASTRLVTHVTYRPKR